MGLMSNDWSNQDILFGLEGLDTKTDIQLVSPTKLVRMKNVYKLFDGSLRTRGAVVQEVTKTTGDGASNYTNALARYNNPATGIAVYLAQVVDKLYYAKIQSGVTTLTQVVASLSTMPPSTFLCIRALNNSYPWIFVANSANTFKVKLDDGTQSIIGLPASAARARFRIDEFSKLDGTIVLTTASGRTRFSCFGFDLAEGSASELLTYDSIYSTTIEEFEAATWTNNAGTGGAPANAVATPGKGTANCIRFTTAVGAAPGAYYNYWAKAITVNLAQVSGKSATDDDHIHLWAYISNPPKVAEVRVYIVCSETFNTATIPGTSTTNNTEAYVKAFRPSDYTSFYEVLGTVLQSSATANTNTQTEQGLTPTNDTRGGTVGITIEQRDPARAGGIEFIGGRAVWTEFGSIGVPLRRGDFRRIGSDTTRGWGTVTGLVVVLVTTDNTNGIELLMDDMYLRGGAGLDTTQIGNTRYDYRYTNYNPTTGVESNPTPIEAGAYALDSIRQGIIVHPRAYGDSAIRQRFYRRGGTLVSNWYYLGVNSSDGATYTDVLSDASIINAPLLETDHDRPVTTTDLTGTTTYANTVKNFFGPVNGIVFAVGADTSSGTLFWCKKDMYDYWPSSNYLEVVGPNEELIAGCVFGGDAYVFSRYALYRIFVNLGSAEEVLVAPTACTKGIPGVNCVTVGPDAIYFFTVDGIYATTGGPPFKISDPIEYVFTGDGDGVFGLAQINTSDNCKYISLKAANDELWFTFCDNDIIWFTLIYSFSRQYWRLFQFGSIGSGEEVSFAVPEEEMFLTYGPGAVYRNPTIGGSVIVGSAGADPVRVGIWKRENTGTTDFGLTSYTCNIRTGALTQGFNRNWKRYGDLVIDANRAGDTLTITPYYNDESASLATVSISTLSGRQRYILNAFAAGVGGFGANGPLIARNVSIDVSWTPVNGLANIYLGQLSYVLHPESTILRVTDWDDQGRMSDKWFKGLLIECDTNGNNKAVRVELDGSTLVTTLTINATDRQALQFTWERARGRLIRLKPTDPSSTAPWLVYNYKWIFDEEPDKLLRWETQELDHGIKGWQIPVYAFLTIQSTDTVALDIVVYNQLGIGVTYSYSIPATTYKAKVYVPFNASKGVTFRYVLTSNANFYLYREESYVCIRPWGSSETVDVKPFGNDDIDGIRSMRDAGLIAARSGGGNG